MKTSTQESGCDDSKYQAAMTDPIKNGMAFAFQNWGTTDMSWLDGGMCASTNRPCGDPAVTISNLKVHTEGSMLLNELHLGPIIVRPVTNANAV